MIPKEFIVPIERFITGHIACHVALNGNAATFIIDTGASFTCVDIEDANLFGLQTEESETKAAGAGATDMNTLIAHNNRLEIGDFISMDHSIILIDLSHVNKGLTDYGADKIQGILGADLFEKSSATIDYGNMTLVLKEQLPSADEE